MKLLYPHRASKPVNWGESPGCPVRFRGLTDALPVGPRHAWSHLVGNCRHGVATSGRPSRGDDQCCGEAPGEPLRKGNVPLPPEQSCGGGTEADRQRGVGNEVRSVELLFHGASVGLRLLCAQGEQANRGGE